MKALIIATLAAVAVCAARIALGVGLEFLYHHIYGGHPTGYGFICGLLAGIFPAVIGGGLLFEEKLK